MKELTLEQKAQRYDEALIKARNIVNSINVGLIGKDSFEAIFPELKESEDEKIRKYIINHFQEHLDTSKRFTSGNMLPPFSTAEVEMFKASVAWLEKQGEQETFPQFTFDDVLALQYAMENVKKVQEDKDLYNELLLLFNKVHDAYTITKDKLL